MLGLLWWRSGPVDERTSRRKTTPTRSVSAGWSETLNRERPWYRRCGVLKARAGETLRGLFLGFLVALLLMIGVELLPKGTTDVGIQYADHGVDPYVTIGIREAGAQYTYLVNLRLLSFGDMYQTNVVVEKVELSDWSWDEWKRVDNDRWAHKRRTSK